ncbi:polyprenyl diphosphate synthase [Kineococcus sp. SYSU DK005]|uniref:polyprenyl diphosphate synthase n=1 Tax=Kineococcus sp. SYSU DK005 TaxID=3383126 RepID=UPI003D7E8DA7
MTSRTPPLTHLAICPDGNGRWATQRGLPRIQGHKQGLKAVWTAVETCIELGIPYLTLAVFSSENWRRESSEVTDLLELIASSAHEGLEVFNRLGVRLRWAGRRDRVPARVHERIKAVETATAGHDALTLTYQADYGGQDDIARAAQRAAQDAVEGRLELADVPGAFRSYLDVPEVPDIDLFIRTSGEQRISNGQLWQLAYAELIFLDVLWPDCSAKDLRNAVARYQQRERRFGSALHGTNYEEK